MHGPLFSRLLAAVGTALVAAAVAVAVARVAALESAESRARMGPVTAPACGVGIAFLVQAPVG
jgi:hypothetical protein